MSISRIASSPQQTRSRLITACAPLILALTGCLADKTSAALDPQDAMATVHDAVVSDAVIRDVSMVDVHQLDRSLPTDLSEVSDLAIAPDVKPDLQMHDLLVADVPVHDISVSDMLVLDSSHPDVTHLEASVPDLSAPDATAPDTYLPDAFIVPPDTQALLDGIQECFNLYWQNVEYCQLNDCVEELPPEQLEACYERHRVACNFTQIINECVMALPFDEECKQELSPRSVWSDVDEDGVSDHAELWHAGTNPCEPCTFGPDQVCDADADADGDGVRNADDNFPECGSPVITEECG